MNKRNLMIYHIELYYKSERLFEVVLHMPKQIDKLLELRGIEHSKGGSIQKDIWIKDEMDLKHLLEILRMCRTISLGNMDDIINNVQNTFSEKVGDFEQI